MKNQKYEKQKTKNVVKHNKQQHYKKQKTNKLKYRKTNKH